MEDEDFNCGLANFSRGVFCCDCAPSAVGSHPPGASPYGLLDMTGNVAEWVQDWYAEGYYSHSPAANPTGPEMGSVKLLRGGSWYDDLDHLHDRSGWFEEGREVDDGGFRCAYPPDR